MSSNMFSLEKLTGRENFSTWKFSMKTYLEHEDLWKCVEPVEGEKRDPKADVKAKAKMVLLLDPQIYVHVQECTTAKEVWENLQKAFDDNGLTRRVGLLKDLINTTLESSNSVEDYVSKIMTTAHKLRNINFDVNDEWLGTLMLAGLPEVYKPMIMGLESSGNKISADLVKTKLIQEVNTSNQNTVFYTNSKSNNTTGSSKAKGPRCFNCNRYGHLAKFCRSKKKSFNKEHTKGESSSFVAAFSATIGEDRDKWYIDSGASMHMSSRNDWMYNITEPPVKNITVANREPLAVKGVGYADIHLEQDRKIQIKNILYVPGLAANLLSVSTIVKCGYKVTFNEKTCDICDTNGRLVCTATLHNKLYILDTKNNYETAHLSNADKSDDAYLWHLRMGHLNMSDVKKLPSCAEGVTLTQNKSDVTSSCIHCFEGKQARLPFKNVGSRASKPLELIHSDLCGPMETTSYGGMKYFITFIDDFSRMVHVYFMKDKLNVTDIFNDFKMKVENKHDSKVKILRTDNGTEYCNSTFEKFLSKHGILHQTSAPYTPQHNGLAERKNRVLVERARCMLFCADLDKRMWAEALATAAYIINRSPNRALEGKTPYEMWTGKKPNLSHMKIFGSVAMVHVPKEKRQKWDKKSAKMLLVGYCENTKGYRLMDLKTNKVIKSRDVAFIEENRNILTACHDNVSAALPLQKTPVIGPSSPDKKMNPEAKSSSQQEATSSTVESVIPTPSDTKLSNDSDKRYDEDDSTEYTTDIDELDVTYSPPCKLQQTTRSNINLRPRDKLHKQNDRSTYLCLFTNLTDPQTVEEALSSPQAVEWKNAMDEEFSSLIKNDTWMLTELPAGKRALPSKWVFKTKTDQSGNIVRYKARLVIKGYAQIKGRDYEEIFSPVVRYPTIRYLFALAARHDLQIDQMDAVSAFLQGEIDKDIYMQQPEEYRQGTQVCLLKKSIYGLKQASRLWNIKLNNVLHELGMRQSQTDPCVYYNDEKNAFIAVWVDDLIMFTSQQIIKDWLKENLKQHFEMKDLGEASQCIGLNITRTGNKVMLDQEKYISDILARFKMTDCKAVRTPIEVGLKFNEDTEEEMLDCPYQQAIGALLYVAQSTRPDISFAVNMLSRYNKEPKQVHWTAVKRIFRYLQGTKNMKLIYTKDGNENITGFCDADWASDVRDRKSCTGYIFLLQGGAISWRSQKQQTVALSTAEAEYMAMSSASQEALWLQQLDAELCAQQSAPMTIFSDNQSAIRLSANDCYLPRSKHIDIRYHFLRVHVNNLRIKFCYIGGDKMVADVLTKGTTADKHLYCVEKMGLRSKGGC